MSTQSMPAVVPNVSDRSAAPASPKLLHSVRVIVPQHLPGGRGRTVLVGRNRQPGPSHGRITFPGGQIFPNEAPIEGAMRKVCEETGRLHPVLQPAPVARLDYCGFPDGDWRLWVFLATAYYGWPAVTSQFDPFWVHRDRFPYDETHAPDREWIQRVLSGERLVGLVLAQPDGGVGQVDLRPMTPLDLRTLN